MQPGSRGRLQSPMRYRGGGRYGEGSRCISGSYRVQRGCGPIKGFYRCPVRELSPVSSLSRWKKMGNYHRRIVCESDREVFRGHVARARCRDAALPDATAALNAAQGGPLDFIYLNIQTANPSPCSHPAINTNESYRFRLKHLRLKVICNEY